MFLKLKPGKFFSLRLAAMENASSCSSCLSMKLLQSWPNVIDQEVNTCSSLSCLAPLEAALFDIDGTLCYSYPVHFDALCEMLQVAKGWEEVGLVLPDLAGPFVLQFLTCPLQVESWASSMEENWWLNPMPKLSFLELSWRIEEEDDE
ncbi:hypothetical protein LguiB_028357 [Lonicera macranthoides]